MKYIENIIGRAALLEQLAEEASELAKAALKQSRIIRGENPTPVTLEKAYSDLIEEYSDVIQCSRELELQPDEEQITRKYVRWYSRINLHREAIDE